MCRSEKKALQSVTVIGLYQSNYRAIELASSPCRLEQHAANSLWQTVTIAWFLAIQLEMGAIAVKFTSIFPSLRVLDVVSARADFAARS